MDHAQLTLQGMKPSNLGLGVVIAIFSLVGFECATAFGEETKTPLKTIPRAVIWSLLATGVFFVLVSYMEVYGTRNYPHDAGPAHRPAEHAGRPERRRLAQGPDLARRDVSFFSLALSCMNAGARILYPMGRHGVFHAAVGQSHDSTRRRTSPSPSWPC